MSAFVSEPLRRDENELASLGHDGSIQQARKPKHSSRSKQDESEETMTAEENGPNNETEISATQKMLSAVSGSLLTSLLVTPLDVVRVRLQSQPPPKPSASLASFANLPPNLGVTACCREVFWVNNTSPFCIAATPSLATPGSGSASTSTSLNSALVSPSNTAAADCAVDETRRRTFTSTLDGLRKVASNEGPAALWRGLSPTLVMAIPANVIYFTGYDSLRSNPHSPVAQYVPDAYAPLLAGSLARVAAASVISPIEMFRTRMQAATSGSGTGVFAETLVGLRKMVKAQGYASLWRGLTLTMWRDVPFSGIYWWGYEAVRKELSDLRDPPHQRTNPRQAHRDHTHASTFVDSFVAGAISGGVASVVTTPFDVGKTRQQVLDSNKFQESPITGSSSQRALRPEERSMLRFLHHIWADEGVAGLFRGWAARCLKVAPACAIMISSYEVGKKMARKTNQKKKAEKIPG